MATTQPNVLLICTDHWPGSLLGCAGNPTVLTPTLDQLARNGVYFPNAYSECPVCVPARRTLMTGLTPHSHGLLRNGPMPMPQVPSLADAFSSAGYQTFAVGKLHVNPPRNRIGFDDVMLDEEGRMREGFVVDDYDLFLADQGHPGQRFAGGMCNNHYMWRPWHLPEALHVTNWTAQQMSRQIARRDPRKPGFWYLSFSQPHPPMVPLQAYLDLYQCFEVPEPHVGRWAQGDPRAEDELALPIQREMQRMRDACKEFTPAQIRAIRRAFYASVTHIDHQIRVVLGTLRDHKLIDNTVICFTADHGEMLGNHRFWAKHWMYEDSARVPMLLSGTPALRAAGIVGHDQVDTRLVGLRDIMPTLLSLAGVEVPSHCEGLSMVGPERRDYLYGVFGEVAMAENASATRMIRDARYKLIYYPEGNVSQLFDMQTDPNELTDLAGDAGHAHVLRRLQQVLTDNLKTEQERRWVGGDGQLVGDPAAVRRQADPEPNYSGQHGVGWPTPA